MYQIMCTSVIKCQVSVFQPYHGENKLHFDEMMVMLYSRPTSLVRFFSASSLKHLPTDRHVAPLGDSILVPSHPIFALVH
jgi:hypothetical protein